MTNNTLVKMILDRWNATVKNCDDLFASLSDEQLEKQIVPGRNRGVYLLGHLIAVHDSMLPLMELGDNRYPELQAPFHDEPDSLSAEFPPTRELRQMWKDQTADLKQRFETIQPENWFQKHTSVSAEDFAKEPHRNKLNIVLTRTTHLAYHAGQLVLLVEKIPGA
jgi:hypothetical protein